MHVNYAAAVADVGLTLRPTDLFIFGKPKGGTLLMQSAQELGIDLPLTVLVWRDDRGTTSLSYFGPIWLVQRHGGAPRLRFAIPRHSRCDCEGRDIRVVRKMKIRQFH